MTRRQRDPDDRARHERHEHRRERAEKRDAPALPEDARRAIAQEVERVVTAHGGEVLDLRVTPWQDVHVVVDRDDGVIDVDQLTRILYAVRGSITALGHDPGDFKLEVDSPGQRRLLRTPRHFERFAGQAVYLVYTSGERRRVTLLGGDGERARVREQDGTEGVVDPRQLREMRLAP